MIQLYHFGPAWGVDDPSPYCLKVLTYMRLAGIPFESKAGIKYLRGAPKGKLPYINDNGRIVPDSMFIIAYLKEAYGDTLEPRCSTQDRGALRAICRMFDEDLYWAVVYFRWMDQDNWEHITKPAFFGGMPWPMRSILAGRVHKGMRRTLHGQGVGRHKPEEISALQIDNLKAVGDFLGNKAFIAGTDPSEADATVHAFLENIATPPHSSPLKTFVESQENLMGYLGRMRERLGGSR